ncbi:MAG: GHKL domain-containing protein [Akkermansia sp.]|nr:GHKL domain-containing protein [Akkermansia sp.]
MQPLPEQIIEPLERINAVYFSDPGRTIELAQGEQLVDQGEECRRVYYVQKGSFAAFRRADSYDGVNLPVESNTRGYEVFRAEAGSYVCVQAFFSRSYHSSNQIVALEDSVVTYVDDTTEVVEPETYGCFERQFIPVLVHELAARNSRIFTKTSEKEEALRVLQRAEMASSLAQLSAGIAHELNNAVGVLSRRTEFVADSLQEYLEDDDKNNALLFSYGFEDNSFISAQELRSAARYYEREFKLPQEAAKVLAHIFPNTEDGEKLSGRFIRNVKKNYRFWELGHDLRDMRMASKLATGIVRAVKLLGGGNSTREPDTSVEQSVTDALNLLHNKLKRVSVTTHFAPMPGITADITELVQVWSNIIKNACDAMEQGGTEAPAIRITGECCHVQGVQLLPTEYVSVTIANNGPAIDEENLNKIFNPNFTTKKLGLDFGLGLGLAIVRRVVDSYNGTIEVRSNDQETSFTINIPTTQFNGNA